MEDMGEKIRSILSDEESMKQISELAEMLSAGMDNTQSDSPNSVPDLSSLLSGLTGGNSGSNSSSGDIDISKMMQLMSAVSGAGADDKNTALIAALKPYLSEQKQKKAEKAIKLLKVLAIFSALKEQGLLDDLSL
ncbi:MAG: hypothetical protein J5999_03335 [Oscillospiraceae bacterium]|nr:hypothetical protein [Oscillospiraceae bacterium]